MLRKMQKLKLTFKISKLKAATNVRVMNDFLNKITE